MIEILLGVLGVCFFVGMIVAIPFVAVGVKKIDLAAREGTRGFKLLIVPGVVVFLAFAV